MEIQRHYITALGDHYVAIFPSQLEADAYTPPTGAIAVPPRPSLNHQWIGGEWVYVEPEPTPVTASDVWAERDRRLAGGFDYDFGYVRGVHRINTTPADMIGWDEVTKFAQALINAGQGAQVITIATGSGMTQLTANEWQGVLIAAAAFRQPIWGASFVLEQMGEIPADFANDAYWTP